jgi:hypothetical protein
MTLFKLLGKKITKIATSPEGVSYFLLVHKEDFLGKQAQKQLANIHSSIKEEQGLHYWKFEIEECNALIFAEKDNETIAYFGVNQDDNYCPSLWVRPDFWGKDIGLILHVLAYEIFGSLALDMDISDMYMNFLDKWKKLIPEGFGYNYTIQYWEIGIDRLLDLFDRMNKHTKFFELEFEDEWLDLLYLISDQRCFFREPFLYCSAY